MLRNLRTYFELWVPNRDCTFKVFWVYAVIISSLRWCKAFNSLLPTACIANCWCFSFNNVLHVDKDDLSPTAEVWDVDQGLMSKLKEQYKKERKGKRGAKSKCSCDCYHFLCWCWKVGFLMQVYFLCHKGSN